MNCKKCGYELAVKEWLEEENLLLLACRNKQCTAYNKDVKVREPDSEPERDY